MDTKRNRDYSVGLERLRRRFERYRRNRKVHSPIPEVLWAAAARAAGTFGISRIAKALRLNYYDLKKRVERNVTGALGASKPKASQFIELFSPAADGRSTPSVQAFLPAGGCDCTVELEDACGAKMRIHLQSTEPPDLAELGRDFWSRRS
jgi:hypothetical protein